MASDHLSYFDHVQVTIDLKMNEYFFVHYFHHWHSAPKKQTKNCSIFEDFKRKTKVTCLIGIRLIEGVIVLSYICLPAAAAAAAATAAAIFFADAEVILPLSLALDVGLLFGLTIACISRPLASVVHDDALAFAAATTFAFCGTFCDDGDPPICTDSAFSAIEISTCGVK